MGLFISWSKHFALFSKTISQAVIICLSNFRRPDWRLLFTHSTRPVCLEYDSWSCRMNVLTLAASNKFGVKRVRGSEYVYLFVHVSKIAFGYSSLSNENQSLLDPLFPLLACPLLLIFPHSIAHFHILQTCYPCLSECNLHQFRNRWDASSRYLFFWFLSDGQLSALVSLL